VRQAVDLYAELRYAEARAAFESAARLEGNRADDLAAIHLHLGMLAGAEDREDEAEEHFRLLLAVDPSAELPAGQPPKISRPFASAQAFWGTARLRVEHDPPREWVVGRPADLRIETADDLLHIVSAARLHVWRVGEGAERAYRQEGAGPFVFPVPEDLLQEAGEIAYRVELLGPDSSVIHVLGDEALVVPVTPAPPGPVPEIRTIVRNVDPAPEPPRPVWRRWWFWTIIGVAVAGVAAGTAVALVVPGRGIDFGAPTLAEQ
jgi:hypothetical protein